MTSVISILATIIIAAIFKMCFFPALTTYDLHRTEHELPWFKHTDNWTPSEIETAPKPIYVRAANEHGVILSDAIGGVYTYSSQETIAYVISHQPMKPGDILIPNLITNSDLDGIRGTLTNMTIWVTNYFDGQTGFSNSNSIPITTNPASTLLPKPPIIYDNCDSRIDTNWVILERDCNGTNFIGVYNDMVAIRHPEDVYRYAGVMMLSACEGYQGEYLKDISEQDFKAIFVFKTRPEYK